MDAMRCLHCGDVRWSLLGLRTMDPGRCELCGGATVPERRRPEPGLRRADLERRDDLDLASTGPLEPTARPTA